MTWSHATIEQEERRAPKSPRAEPPAPSVQELLRLQRTAGNGAVSALLARARDGAVPERRAGARVLQRIRSNYAVALPSDEMWRLKEITPDDTYSQAAVDKFVDGLKREQMVFYESSMAALLESNRWPKANVQDPFGGRAPITMWQCPNCKQPTTYQGIDRGHDTNWKPELKQAGVKNLNEATIVYNNLNNLRIECRACNVSHAFERNTQHHFMDLPSKDDFPSGKKGRERHEALMQSYSGFDMDAYDMTDDFMDTSSGDLTLVTRKPITLSFDKGAIHAGTSETFWGGAQVRVTGEEYLGGSWLQVEVIESWDLKLPKGTTAWASFKHLKAGDISAF